jgi:glycosyltransferase involved in cell wall biosynthesis
VLIVVPDGGTGGAETAVHRLLPHLSERWRAVVWMPPGDGEAAAAGAEEVVLADRPIRYSIRGLREPPGLIRRVVATVPYLIRFARCLRRVRPSVVHANSFYALPEATVARLLGVPVVLHVHDIPPAGTKARAIHRWSRVVASRVVACSRAAAEPFAEAGSTVVTVIPNGVPLPSGRRPTADAPVVGTVARIEHRKGIDVFLDAAVRLAAARPEIRFRVWGPDGLGADAAYAARIHERVRRLAGEGIDVSAGPVRDAGNAIGGWAVFVLASRQDPYPLATLEAMAWGLPVVGTRAGGIPDQIDDGYTGLLVPPDDPEAIAAAVLDLLNDDGRAAAMGRAARARSASRTVEVQAAALSEVYREVARGGEPRLHPLKRRIR